MTVDGEPMQTSRAHQQSVRLGGAGTCYAAGDITLHIAIATLLHNTMPGLTDLPSELLFQIIDHTLTSSGVLPKDGMRYRPEWKACVRNLYCIPSSSKEFLNTPQALNLLLTSQRINTETKEYISKAPQTFEFDIAVVNDHWVSAELDQHMCS
jgi:hypothetical protein